MIAVSKRKGGHLSSSPQDRYMKEYTLLVGKRKGGGGGYLSSSPPDVGDCK